MQPLLLSALSPPASLSRTRGLRGIASLYEALSEGHPAAWYLIVATVGFALLLLGGIAAAAAVRARILDDESDNLGRAPALLRAALRCSRQGKVLVGSFLVFVGAGILGPPLIPSIGDAFEIAEPTAGALWILASVAAGFAAVGLHRILSGFRFHVNDDPAWIVLGPQPNAILRICWMRYGTPPDNLVRFIFESADDRVTVDVPQKHAVELVHELPAHFRHAALGSM